MMGLPLMMVEHVEFIGTANIEDLKADAEGNYMKL